MPETPGLSFHRVNLPEPPGLAAAVDAAFAILETPDRSWAREFVLDGWDGDPGGDCAALCNPLALRCGEANESWGRAETLHSGAAAVSAPSVPSSAVSVGWHSNSVRIPAWSHAGLTVGMAIETCYASANDSAQASTGAPSVPFRQRLSIGRFARDESSGEMLVVAREIPSPASQHVATMVTVKYVRNSSTRDRDFLWMHCDYAALRAVRNAASASAFYSASVMCNVTKDITRACPLCRMALPEAARCNCRLPRSSPRGPTDFSNFRANGLFDLGEWKGVSSFYFAQGPGRLSRSKTFMSETTTAYADSEHTRLSNQLQSLAIQERLLAGAFCKPSPSMAGSTHAGLPAITDGKQVLHKASAGSPFVYRTHDAPLGISAELPSVALPLPVERGPVQNLTNGAEVDVECVAGQVLPTRARKSDETSFGREIGGRVSVEVSSTPRANNTLHAGDIGDNNGGHGPTQIARSAVAVRGTLGRKPSLASAETFDGRASPIRNQQKKGGGGLGNLPAAELPTDMELEKQRRRQESRRLAATRSKARQREYEATLTQKVAAIQLRLQEAQQRHASALAVNSALKEVAKDRRLREPPAPSDG